MTFEKKHATFFPHEVEPKKHRKKSSQTTFVVFPKETTFVA